MQRLQLSEVGQLRRYISLQAVSDKCSDLRLARLPNSGGMELPGCPLPIISKPRTRRLPRFPNSGGICPEMEISKCSKPKPRWDVHFQSGRWYGRTACRWRGKHTVDTQAQVSSKP